MTDLIELLEQHYASITDADEETMDEEWNNELNLTGTEPGHPDYASFAYRTCQCGESIEGFYEYLDHIKDVIRKASQ